MDLAKGFQRFETRHKADTPPGPQNQPRAHSCNECAGPHTEAEYLERHKGRRKWLGIALVFWSVTIAFGIAAGQGWFDRWLS